MSEGWLATESRACQQEIYQVPCGWTARPGTPVCGHTGMELEHALCPADTTCRNDWCKHTGYEVIVYAQNVTVKLLLKDRLFNP